MMIPQATVEGFEPSPPPADWTEQKPVYGAEGAAKPVVSRFERPYGSTGAGTVTGAGTGAGATGTTGAPVALPPRTIGSKIPINRRHKRRR
jgi:hypothetical protein